MQASSCAVRDELIRGMGLRDVAGAADHRRAAGLLEQPGFCPVGHRARAVRARERHRQSDGLRAWLGEERRHAPLMQRLDRRRRGHASHARQQPLIREGLDLLRHKIRVGLG